MKRNFESLYHFLEERHWWFVGRREIISKLVKQISPERKDIKILEIGCSGGPLLNLLLSQGYSQVFGIDVSRKAIKICKERGLKNVFLMDGAQPHFNNEEFDLIVASDVLEHIKDDEKAVSEWKRILKKKGFIICFVPALKVLWSEHDENNEHYRRYIKRGLEYVFEVNNLSVIRSSYWNTTLFLPTVFYRFLSRASFFKLFSGNQLKESNFLLDFLLKRLLRMENYLLTLGFNYPIGISVFVIAQKTQR